MTDSIDF